MTTQRKTTGRAAAPRLPLCASPATGMPRRCGLGGHVFAAGGNVPSPRIAGNDEGNEGGRVSAAGGAM